MSLHQEGRLKEAADLYRRILQDDPDNASIIHLLGVIAHQQNRHHQACEYIRKAMAILPDTPIFHNNLGSVLSALGRENEAADAFEKALALKPDYAEAYYNTANLLVDQGRYEEASEYINKALSIHPGYGEAYNTLGLIKESRGRYEEAVEHYQKFAQIRPASPQSYYNCGNALKKQGKISEAAVMYKKAVSIDHDYVEAHWNLALSLLLQGDYIDGWREYEWRFRRANRHQYYPVAINGVQWDGALFRNKSLFVHHEQGLGDTLQFVRYLPLVKQRGGKVTFHAPSSLISLFSHFDFIDELIGSPPEQIDHTRFDYYIPLMSLPRIFNTVLDTVPAQVPYIFADPTKAAVYKKRISEKGLNVGIVWAGHRENKLGRHRSCGFHYFYPLLNISHLHVYGLQKEESGQSPVPVTGNHTFINFGSEFNDFSDTSAAVETLDLIITIDTSVAHLAGAMGKEVWTLLPFSCDWRWLLNRTDTPWYPTMRLFRQAGPNDWTSVFNEVEKKLKERTSEEITVRTDGTALMTKAISLHKEGRIKEAKQAYDAVPENHPGHVDALHLKGVTYYQQHDYVRARKLILQALSIKDKAEFHNNLGLVLAGLKRDEEARSSYKKALQLKPDYGEPCYNLGNLLRDQGQVPEALAWYKRALSFKSDYSEVYINMGELLENENRLEEALECCKKAGELKPDDFLAHYNMGNIYRKMNDPVQAAEYYKRALVKKPDHFRASTNLGLALQDLGKYEAAFHYYRHALSIDPNHVDANWNQGFLYLLTGNYEKGWEGYEWRKKTDEWQRDYGTFHHRRLWDGSVFTDQRLYIHDEQGLGDGIQMVRYLPMVKERGGTVVLETTRPLVDLFKSLPGVDEVVTASEDPEARPEFDLYLPLMSLPSRFHTRPETIPNQIPYIKADPIKADHWRKRLTGDGFRLGIVWAGGKAYSNDRNRSCSLSLFKPLIEINGGTVYGLQKGEAGKEADGVADVINYGQDFEDFSDTAAFLDHLDLVITVDTAVAHLAGAMGKEVWTLVPFNCDWRWLINRNDTPWYPTMELFRQEKPNDWKGAFHRVGKKLTMRLSKPLAVTSLHSTGDSLEIADRHIKARRFNEAEAVLNQVIKTMPDHGRALYLTGLIAFHNRRYEQARRFFQQALQQDPDEIDYHIALAQVLAESGDDEKAVVLYEKALELDDSRADLYNDLGCRLKAMKRYPEALERFQQAFCRRSDYSDAYFNTANILREQQNHPEAIDYYQKAIACRSDFLEAFNNLGIAQKKLKQWEEAERSFKKALSLKPDYAAAYNNLGNLLNDRERYDEAAACFMKATTYEPGYAQAWYNYGYALNAADNIEEAEKKYRQALRIQPDFTMALNNLGVALQRQNKLESAIFYLEKAVQTNPDFADAHWNLALALLATGEYERGWEEYEWRFKRPNHDNAALKMPPMPRWDGSSFAGKILYVFDEQGFGDTIQFLRYLPMVKELGGQVVFGTTRSLINLLKDVPDIDQVIDRSASKGGGVEGDYAVSLMSLAKLFETRPDTIPDRIPYLVADREKVAYFKEKMETTAMKVGFSWAGRSTHPNDRRRSCDFKYFESLFNISGIHFYSLQKEKAAVSLEDIVNVTDFGPELHDFSDTAALIENLDLVISVDTAVAHLAGAMGKPVWMLLPFSPDWRWLLQRTDSPWYPTMRLFRQSVPGSWEEVFQSCAKELVMQKDRSAVGEENVRPVSLLLKNALDHQYAGRLDEAARLYREILNREPDHVDALHLSGLIAHQKGQHEQAVELIQQAINRQPDLPYLYNNLGLVYQSLDMRTHAVLAFQDAVQKKGDFAEAYYNLGNALYKEGRGDGALVYFKRASEHKQGFAQAENNQGVIYEDREELEKALEKYRLAVEMMPDFAEAYNNLGGVLERMGRYDEALENYDRAVLIQPDYEEAWFNRALAQLLLGDYQKGWQGYQWRFEKHDWKRAHPRQYTGNEWDGRDFKDKKLLIHDEQGLGDAIQFVRYLPIVKQRGATVLFETQQPLIKLFKDGKGMEDIIIRDGYAQPPLSDYDMHISLLSLPLVLKTDLYSIPSDIPYLYADPEKVDLWKKRLNKTGFAAGVVWAGKPSHKHDADRSISADHFVSLAEKFNIRLIGLQKGEAARRLERFSDAGSFENVGETLDDFSDTAAVIEHLDLVISVDTAVAHLAGAMGKPVWTLLPFSPDWRWLLNRSDSPWYPSMRLFRQHKRGDWGGVFNEVEKALKEMTFMP